MKVEPWIILFLVTISIPIIGLPYLAWLNGGSIFGTIFLGCCAYLLTGFAIFIIARFHYPWLVVLWPFALLNETVKDWVMRD